MSHAQMTLALARAAGDAGMNQATGHAERVNGGITDLMYAYLVKFALNVPRGERFTAEVVTDSYASDSGFEQPTDQRAWGGVFLRAMNKGVLSIADFNGVRRKGHGTKGAKRYRSLVTGRRWTELMPPL